MRLTRLSVLALCLLWSQTLHAACDSRVTLVDFGRLDLEKGGDITGELSVTCNRPGRFEVALSPGLGSYRLRKMEGPDGIELTYNLYVDPSRRRVWGDGQSNGTAKIEGESDGRKTRLFPIYGFVPGGQRGSSGAYSDQLQVQLNRLP